MPRWSSSSSNSTSAPPRRNSVAHVRPVGRVFAETFAADPAAFHITEAALQAWQDAGLSRAESAQRTVLLRHFVVGFCIEEQALAALRKEHGEGLSTN